MKYRIVFETRVKSECFVDAPDPTKAHDLWAQGYEYDESELGVGDCSVISVEVAS